MIKDRPTLVADTMRRFLFAPIDEVIAQHLVADPEEAAVALFKTSAREVPAYQKFLQAHSIEPEKINSYQDYQALPLTTKQNYMQVFPLPERCRKGRLIECDRIAVSSGSTGKPTIWPRAFFNEQDAAWRFEHVFRHSFCAHERTTLAVVCFALGNWVGGLYTLSCCWQLAQKGYPITVAAPGNKKEEIFRVVEELAPYFEQTVLLGYPPFVKDVIDAGLAHGIDWPRYRVKAVFAGEVFSEQWRSSIGERLGSNDPCYDSASLYGTADGGVLGNETPLSIAIRRFLAAEPSAARALFGEARLPTLVQYDPLSRFFETHEGTLVVSGDSGIPLVRYHIADKGGVIAYGAMLDFLKKWGVSLKTYGYDEARPAYPLPFVYVFGRADFTVSFYGANIFPENIAVGLEQPSVRDWVSGKFVLEVQDTATGDHYLSVTAELLPGVSAEEGKESALAQSIKEQLLRLNSEFAHYVPPEKQQPKVTLRPFEDPEYFPPGVKHRYTRR